MDARSSRSGDEGFRVTRDGALLGACVSDHALVWYGVPYASAPVGERRWRAPGASPTFEGVRDATQRVPPACQRMPFSTPDEGAREGSIVGDEDCLYLTIWSPRRTTTAQDGSDPLPVLVWFHGGGNMVGDGADFDASRLASSQNVIVVAVNHRLNILGWFAHRALRCGDATPEERSGNFALLDQIAALRWIGDNIRAFGGNAGRITLFGHSGGGWNVRALLCSPPARGLFHGAIVQSVGAYQLLSSEHAENFVNDEELPGHPLSGNELLLSLWLADGRAADIATATEQIRAAPDAEIAAFLRAQPFPALSRAIASTGKRNAAANSSEALTQHASRRPPQMFTDGVVLTDQIQSRVPIMFGTARYEDRTFLSADRRFVTNLYGHPVIRDPARYAILSEYLGKLYAARGTHEPARACSNQGLAVYGYRFDWDELASPAWLDFRALIGAGHGSELPLLFGTTRLGPEYDFQGHLYDDREESSFRQVGAAMMSYWAAFARDGAPGRGAGGELPEWRAFGAGEIMVIDAEAGGGIRMSTETSPTQDVIAQIRSDERLPTGPLRRRLVSDFQGHSITRLDAADYCMLAS